MQTSVAELPLARTITVFCSREMENLQERLVAGRKKLNALFSERARAIAAVEGLETRLRDQSREADVLRARIKELEQENEVYRTAKAAPVAVEREGTKEKIDELVIEIDRCLALLHN